MPELGLTRLKPDVWYAYAEQMYVLVRMQLRNHADAQPKQRFKRQKG